MANKKEDNERLNLYWDEYKPRLCGTTIRDSSSTSGGLIRAIVVVVIIGGAASMLCRRRKQQPEFGYQN